MLALLPSSWLSNGGARRSLLAVQVLPGAGRESEGTSETAGAPGALQRYFVTAHSEAWHTAFATSSPCLSSFNSPSPAKGAASHQELGHWGGRVAAIHHIDCGLHWLVPLVRHFAD